MFNNNLVQEYVNGGIYWGDCGHDKMQGEQQGIRPVMIIQNDIGNKFSPTVIVAVLTTKINKARKVPTHVIIQDNIMPQESMVMLEQIYTMNKSRLGEYIGTVSEFTMKKIRKAMDISLANHQHIDGVNDAIFTVKLPKEVKNELVHKLKDIRGVETVIASTKNPMLRKSLLEERQMLLEDVESFCSENNLNYRDFYVRYSVNNSSNKEKLIAK